MKRFLHCVVLSAVLSTATMLPSFSAQVPAKSAPILLSQNVNFIPPDVGAPDNRQGATHRGICPKDLYIIPLIPNSNRGLTVSAAPTFFAYVSHPSITVKFTLEMQEEGAKDTEVVYTTDFKVDKPGIVEVSIPAAGDSKKSIEVGKTYQWSFSGLCNPDDRSGDYFVKGFIQRIEVEPTLQSNLANSEPMAKAIAYAKNGIWYETLSTLAAMRRQAPEDKAVAVEWQQLLQSQGLDAIATQPLLGPL